MFGLADHTSVVPRVTEKLTPSTARKAPWTTIRFSTDSSVSNALV